MSCPTTKLAETTTPDGGCVALYQEAGDYCIRLNGLQLMHSAGAASELLLGTLGTEGLAARSAPRILIAGLGLGFTLKSVLRNVGPASRIEVAELLPAIVDWNKHFMASLNGNLLADRRVAVLVVDVFELLTRAAEASYDAMLFDVDNGPKALVWKGNARLYGPEGAARIFAVLRTGGRAVFWSADPAPDFVERLTNAGFEVKPVPARFHPAGETCPGAIYVAYKFRAGERPARGVTGEE